MNDLSSHIFLKNPARLAVLDTTNVGGEYALINRINVPVPHRGKGHGSMLLKEVCQKADFMNIELRLEINPYGDLNKDQLIDWYARHGFRKSEEGFMVRYPCPT